MHSFQSKLAVQLKTSWVILVVGMAFGFAGLHVMVAQPMLRQMEQVRRELRLVERQMQEVASLRDHGSAVNSLLVELKAQQVQLDEARLALDSIGDLRRELVAESNRNPQAAAAIELTRDLHDRLIEQQPATEIADSSFEQMKRLESKVASWQAGLSAAAQNLESAQAVSNRLVELQDRLAQGARRADEAHERAEQLINLNETLGREDLNVTASSENLAGLLRLNEQLKIPASRLASAIQSLEVLNSFHDEFVSQIQVLDQMRRSLVEISLMETTLNKVARLMQPLAELGNLRRLSDDELRQAAQAILEGRTATRLSKHSTPAHPPGTASTTDEPVPATDTSVAP